MTPARYSTRRLLLRALMPTGAMVAFSLLVTVAVIVAHILYLTVQAGTLWPSALNGYFGPYYTNEVVQPVLWFTHQQTVHLVVSILLWSIAGSVIFAAIEWSLRAGLTLRAKQHTAEMTGSGRLLSESARWQQALTMLLWRLAIGCLLIGFIVETRPLAIFVLRNDAKIVAGMPLSHVLIACSKSLAIGLGFGYILIVLLRLYLGRTRIHGEII